MAAVWKKEGPRRADFPYDWRQASRQPWARRRIPTPARIGSATRPSKINHGPGRRTTTHSAPNCASQTSWGGPPETGIFFS